MLVPFARQVEVPPKRLDPRLNHWILPTWFYQQAEPHSPLFSSSNDFKNQTCRNWTVLRPERSLESYTLDRYGVLSLGRGYSLEIWFYENGKLIAPVGYDRVEQYYSPAETGVTTIIRADPLQAMICHKLTDYSLDLELRLLAWDLKSLRPIWFILAIRPFGPNGWSPLYQLEYKESGLWINRKKIIYFEEEPSYSFFVNEKTGDIVRYFKEGLGNSGVISSEGLCTGFVGYAGLPSELATLRLSLGSKLSFVRNKRNDGSPGLHIKTGSGPIFGTFTTGTAWDSFWNAASQHLRTFSTGMKADPVCINQIFALNRLGLFENSRDYLKLSLRKIRFTGDFQQFLDPVKWIIGAADYYRLSGDREWLKSIESDIIKLKWYLLQSYGEHYDKGCDAFWVCAAWRDLGELAQAINQPGEARTFKEYYLTLLGKLYGTVSETAKRQNGTSGMGVRESLQFMECSLPLHLWEANDINVGWWLQKFEEWYIRAGGVFSPTEFKGIDLELTAKWCRHLIWTGRNYDISLELLRVAAGGTWSWPDVMNPLSLTGIGQNGHEPRVLYQMVMLWRLIFVHEVGNYLYILPGIFNCKFWERPQLTVDQISTAFGKISISCKTIGVLTEITLKAQYRQKPAKIRLIPGPSYSVCYADACITYNGRMIEADPDVQIIRLKKGTIDACLDNTFSANI